MSGSSVVAAALLAAAAAADTGLEVWRFPYNSPFVITNPRDGLPDFNLTTGWQPANEFTSATIACPTVLQKPCCQKCHKQSEGTLLFDVPLLGGDNCAACCNKSMPAPHIRACAGGIYCEAGVDQIKARLPSAMPSGFRGRSVSTADVPFITRTRANILERAIGWLAHNVPYGGCHAQSWSMETCGADEESTSCPKWSHGGSCCSYVSMALGVSNVQGGRGHSYRKQIHCQSMQPGDFVAQHHPNGGINHWWMFREFHVPGKPDAGHRGYQMGGGKGTANVFSNQSPFCGATKPLKMHCITCYQYAKLPGNESTPDLAGYLANDDVDADWVEPEQEPRAEFEASVAEAVVV